MHIRREYENGSERHVVDTDAIVQWVEYADGECSITARPHVPNCTGYTGRIDITLTHHELLMIADAYNRRIDQRGVRRVPAALAYPVFRQSIFERIRGRIARALTRAPAAVRGKS